MRFGWSGAKAEKASRRRRLKREPSSLDATGAPPANPWSRPSLFARNLRAESADAELFVRLAREQEQKLAKQAARQQRKHKTSTIVTSSAVSTLRDMPTEHEDEEEAEEQSAETPMQEDDDF